MTAVSADALPSRNTMAFREIARAIHDRRPGDKTGNAKIRADIMADPHLTSFQREWLFALVVSRSYGLRTDRCDYVGPVYPGAVIVGDEPGERLESYGAFTPWLSGCGEHLLTALYFTGLTLLGRLNSIGLVNSRHTDIRDLYVRLGRPRLIAAGNRAHARLDNANLPIAGFVRHPQYEKRFKFAEVEHYGTMIREAAMPFTKII